jgi:hypothetical protein
MKLPNNIFKVFLIFSIIVNMSFTSDVVVSENSIQTNTTTNTITTIPDIKFTIMELKTNNSEVITNDEKVNPRIQRQTMACASSPCGSYGLCYDVPFPAPLPAGYYCVCNEGFTGAQCEKGMY